MTRPVLLHPEVESALADGRPVVALETAVVTHGLPRTPLASEFAPEGYVWDSAIATNLAAARMIESAVRCEGAVPAIVAVIDGTLCVGLDEDRLARLAADGAVMKVGARDLGVAAALKRNGGTTVSATLRACRLAGPPSGIAPIRVFATGGIGGAHPGWGRSGDISADLRAIAETPVCVVSAGAKSILDLGATVEMLDSHSVPVIGFGTDHFPRFHTVGDGRLGVQHRVDDIETAARICRHHWIDFGGGGIVLAVPIPAKSSVDSVELELATKAAESRAASLAISGPELTPFLLREMADATGNRLIRANLGLLAYNATIAARLAHSLA